MRPPNDPRHAAAPVREGHQGGAEKRYQADQADTTSVPRSRFSRRLDHLLAEIDPQRVTRHSDKWERSVANQLVQMGFAPEYVARRYGLTRKAAA